MDIKKLRAPFPRQLVRTRPGQHGKQLTYVPTFAVVARLNECSPTWEFTVEEHHEFEGTEVVVLGRLSIEGVVKNAFGGSSITKNKNGDIVSLGDDLKSAASDSLKKAASLFGVPIDGGHESRGDVQGTSTQLEQRREPARQAQRKLAGAETSQCSRSEREQIFVGATVRQLSALHSLARRQGLNQQRLREVVNKQSGKQDISHLSRAEASSLIDFLKSDSSPATQHH